MFGKGFGEWWHIDPAGEAMAVLLVLVAASRLLGSMIVGSYRITVHKSA